MRPLLLAVAALLPLIDLVFAQPPAVAGKKYALLVGVNEYDNRQLANLKYAERDITELAKVLKANGFEVTLLLGSTSGAEKATRANIEKAVTDLLGKVTKRDTLLTAFAGHGEQFKPDGESEEQPFFCPSDAKPNDAKRLYPFNDLLKKLDKDGAGTNLVLVDACRSINDANRGTRSGIDGSKAVSLAVGTVVFFACSRDQEARESEKAGGGHGVFFHHVIDGLKGGAANKRGQVTWDGLVAHVKDQTAATYPDWFPGLPEQKWQQPQSIGNTSGAVVLVRSDIAKGDDLKAGDVREYEVAPGMLMKFCWIPPTTQPVQLGSPRAEQDYLLKTLRDEMRKGWLEEENESGRGVFKAAKGFWLGKFEVTQDEWEMVMGENPSYFDGKRDNKAKGMNTSRFPVEHVSWNHICGIDGAGGGGTFLGKMNARPGAANAFGKAGRFVLPTEDEWEYAARGGKGNKQAFYFGDVLDGTQANCDWKNRPYDTTVKNGQYLERPCAVEFDNDGKYPQHQWGLCHMHGNIGEWCENKVSHTYGDRIVRGGGWNDLAFRCRSAYQRYGMPTNINEHFGFRLCFRLE